MLFEKLNKLLAQAWKMAFLDVEVSGLFWERPPQPKYGDLSTGAALKAASKLQKKPLEIAGILQRVLEDIPDSRDFIEKVSVAGPGFVNITISKEKAAGEFKRFLAQGPEFFTRQKSGKVLLEFVSANPTGPLSAAHGRQAVVGDALAGIFESLGYKVEREYYVNDMGGQIEKFRDSVISNMQAVKTGRLLDTDTGYKGEYLKSIASDLLNKGVTPQDKGEIERLSVGMMLDTIKKVLEDLDIYYDNWASQKFFFQKGKISRAIEKLQEKDYVYEKEGALWFRSTLFGDDKDRVLRRQDGNFSYFAADIAYHIDKVDRGYKFLVNLWGPDHHGYIKRVLSSLKAYYGFEPDLRIIIIQLVTLKGRVKMSKRAGTLVLLQDLINDVGKDAVRFYYLTRKNSSLLEFDVDLAKQKSFDNPLYYIQYAYARICSILRKAQVPIAEDAVSKLVDSDEISLCKDVLFFYPALEFSAANLEPYVILDFLRNLARKFHSFYEKNRVISEDKEITSRRLALIEGVRKVFKTGLDILKISAPEKM